MIISVQGLRTGTGSSFVAANLAEIYARNSAVALASTTPAPGTFETYWGLPLQEDKSWLRQINNNLPLAEAIERANYGYPVLFPFGLMDLMTDKSNEQCAQQFLSTLVPHAFTHTLIDTGKATSFGAKPLPIWSMRSLLCLSQTMMPSCDSRTIVHGTMNFSSSIKWCQGLRSVTD